MVELFGSAMFYEMVGQAKPDDFGMEVVGRHVFDDSRAETSSHDAIFDGYYHESYFKSAPAFDLRIDGITLLNEAY